MAASAGLSKKKVLILGSYGPSLLVFRGPLIAEMIARGHQVVAAAPSIAPETKAALARLGASCVDVPMANTSLNPLALLGSLRKLRRTIRSIAPDVLISYTIKPVIIGTLAARAEKVPRIVALITGAGYAFTPGREIKRRLSRLAASLLYRRALRHADAVIFQNRDDEALFRKLGLVAAGQSIHRVDGSGVDLDHYAPAPLPDRPSFLMIARLIKDKGVREFADAAKRLKREHPETPVALVGALDPSPDSLTRPELDELIACGIDYKGQLADVRGAIAACSVYVLPSFYREGVPRSILEAMSMGRAIVTTDSPGCRETVEQGRNGLLVPPRNADALHSAMLRFVREPELAPRMGEQSRRIAEQVFDVRKVNRDMLAIAGL